MHRTYFIVYCCVAQVDAIDIRQGWLASSKQGTHIAKSLGSTSIRHRFDTYVSDRCLIDVDPRVFAIWVAALKYISEYFHSGFYKTKTKRIHADPSAYSMGCTGSTD